MINDAPAYTNGSIENNSRKGGACSTRSAKKKEIVASSGAMTDKI